MSKSPDCGYQISLDNFVACVGMLEDGDAATKQTGLEAG